MTDKGNKTITFKDINKIRLDVFLKNYLKIFSRGEISNFIEDKKILINNKYIKKHYVLKENDIILIKDSIYKKENTKSKKNYKDLEIIYEDEWIIAINKPNNLSSHYDSREKTNNLTDILYSNMKNYVNNFENNIRKGIIHRLDKYTTGIILFAKSEESLKEFQKLFKNHEIEKCYFAITNNNLKKNKIKFKSYIGRLINNRVMFGVDNIVNPKIATTYFSNIYYDEIKNLSLIKCIPITGKTHQIRVHLKALNCPVLNDPIYNTKSIKNNNNNYKQYLHSYSLSFIHPYKNKKISLFAKFPLSFYEIFIDLDKYINNNMN